MTAPTENQAQILNNDQKDNSKELNFRKQEQMYQRMLKEREEKLAELEKKLQENKAAPAVEDEDDSEPYVDHKRLNKTLNKFGQSTQSEIQKAMELAKQKAKDEVKQELWLEQNPDFYDVLQHAEKFAQKAPQLAESILRMPEGFERQRLVYQNIKTLGIDKPEVKGPSIQEKIDANRRSPYYQPSGTGTAPYNTGTGDFSPAGQKNAYAKMQELKAKLRM